MSVSVGVMDEKSILPGQMMCANTLTLMAENNPTWLDFHLEFRGHFHPNRELFSVYSAPVTGPRTSTVKLSQLVKISLLLEDDSFQIIISFFSYQHVI